MLGEFMIDLNKLVFGTGLNNSKCTRMNTHVFLVVESLPVVKISDKFIINIYFENK